MLQMIHLPPSLDCKEILILLLAPILAHLITEGSIICNVPYSPGGCSCPIFINHKNWSSIFETVFLIFIQREELLKYEEFGILYQ